MASEKLNQAFIKAYGKRNLLSSQTGKNEPSDRQDEWIIRFDTATVQTSVPQMHSQRPPKQAMPQSSTVPGPHSPALLQTESALVATPHSKSSHSKSSQAKSNQSGGSISETRQHLEVSNEDSELLLESLLSQDSWSGLWGTSTMIVPQASLGRSQENPAAANRSTTGSFSIRKTTEEAVVSDEPVIPSGVSQNTAKSGSDGGVDIAPCNELEPESKLKIRLDSQADSPAEPVAEPASKLSDLEEQIEAKNRDGEILRLDRLDKAITESAMDPASHDETDIGVSGHSQKEAQGLRVAIESPDEADQFNADEQLGLKEPGRQKTLATEQVLRLARKRIFNPLWEVDRLDWPRVCVELMSAIEHKSPAVATNLSNACQDGLQVLAVTSPVSGAGTSTVACCLAMLAGRHGLNIALVDGNLENPSLCYQTNLEIELDWHEAIAKRMPLEEVSVHSVDDQITMVPLLARLSAPQLNEQSIATVLQELSQSFDLVIVDLGPMAASKNMVSALGSQGILNAVVTVVDRRESNTASIESCLRQIRIAGISSIGLVENFAA